MSETKIFCSIIIFILGIYTLVILQYELFKLNGLSGNGASEVESSKRKGGDTSIKIERKHVRPSCNSTLKKSKFSIGRLNCGSAGDLIDLVIENCTELLPCDIQHNVNYSVVLHFAPSMDFELIDLYFLESAKCRNVSKLEIQTSVRQRKDLKYLHQESMHVEAKEGEKTALKFSFLLPPDPIFKKRKKMHKCLAQGYYFLGLEIWDVASGIGELCLSIPMLVYM